MALLCFMNPGWLPVEITLYWQLSSPSSSSATSTQLFRVDEVNWWNVSRKAGDAD